MNGVNLSNREYQQIIIEAADEMQEKYGFYPNSTEYTRAVRCISRDRYAAITLNILNRQICRDRASLANQLRTAIGWRRISARLNANRVVKHMILLLYPYSVVLSDLFEIVIFVCRRRFIRIESN